MSTKKYLKSETDANKHEYIGLQTGFRNLDNLTNGFKKSELIIIGGRPGVGKTTFALTLASNIAVDNKIPVGYFSLEMTGKKTINRVIQIKSHIPLRKPKSEMTPEEFNIFTNVVKKIYDAPLHVDATPNMYLKELKREAESMVNKEDVKIIFIDYLGLIHIENMPNLSVKLWILHVLKSLKTLAEDLKIPIVCLSMVGRSSSAGKAPVLSDFRYSESIKQYADKVMFLHKKSGEKLPAENFSGNMIDVNIVKNNNGIIGSTSLILNSNI